MKPKIPATVKPKKSGTAQSPVKQQSKQAQLIELLKKKAGATVEEMIALTGWQAHYADVLVMPISAGNPTCAAESAVMKSA